MFSVLVGNIKGGCGKTTIATHLAAGFARAGLKTVIGDCDRQRSSLNWLRRRDPQAAPIAGLDWVKTIDELPKDTERLVIDAPAAMSHKAVKELIDIADVVVVPVLPSAFDEDATAHFLGKLSEVKVVRRNKRVVAVVGNRLRPGTKASAHLDSVFGDLGFPVVARLRDSQIYPALAAEGATILDSRSRRARGYAGEWGPLLRLVGL
ncbi:MAG: ParA family protein [Magnetospirillum sp.]|nr:ParA family protein [Magnetospirillum sp.]